MNPNDLMRQKSLYRSTNATVEVGGVDGPSHCDISVTKTLGVTEPLLGATPHEGLQATRLASSTNAAAFICNRYGHVQVLVHSGNIQSTLLL
jgi:hypothetical protein